LKNAGGLCALVKKVCPFAIFLWNMCHGKSVVNIYVQHKMVLIGRPLYKKVGEFQMRGVLLDKKVTTETSCFRWREILQHWCSNGSKCQKIFALIGYSIPSVKNFTMPDNETYKTMAKLRVIQQLSSGLGHRNLLLQSVSRISSWWISWLEYVDFMDEHSSHSGDTTKSKWQIVV